MMCLFFILCIGFNVHYEPLVTKIGTGDPAGKNVLLQKTQVATFHEVLQLQQVKKKEKESSTSGITVVGQPKQYQQDVTE